ncbi:MAG: DPP IV N-terminal domain-containing protein [Elusimicrobiota bacterium]
MFSRYFEVKTVDYVPKGEREDIELWKSQGVESVIYYNVIRAKMSFVIEGKIYDMQTGDRTFHKNFKGTEDNYRKTAHEFSDEIVRSFTGQRGISHTKIVFVNDGTGKKELYVSDYDGANVKKITSDNSICITPRWDPDGKRLAYTSWKMGNPDLFVMDVSGTEKKRISSYQGLNTSPSWLASGDKFVLTLSRGKSPNIFMINLKGEILKQITYGKNINTSSSISKTGTQIIFISDKSGLPQMYLTDTDGANTRRIYTDGYSDTPCFSPRGDAIAFSMKTTGPGFFDIYIYDIMNSKQYQLTSNSASNESPSFSPDGRFITFSSTRNGKKEIFTMFADGSGQMRLLNIKGNSEMPDWSP